MRGVPLILVFWAWQDVADEVSMLQVGFKDPTPQPYYGIPPQQQQVGETGSLFFFMGSLLSVWEATRDVRRALCTSNK